MGNSWSCFLGCRALPNLTRQNVVLQDWTIHLRAKGGSQQTTTAPIGARLYFCLAVTACKKTEEAQTHVWQVQSQYILDKSTTQQVRAADQSLAYSQCEGDEQNWTHERTLTLIRIKGVKKGHSQPFSALSLAKLGSPAALRCQRTSGIRPLSSEPHVTIEPINHPYAA